VAPAVKIFACLDLEQNISFLDGHQLTLQLHKKHGNMRLKPVGKGFFGVFRNAAGIHSRWNPEKNEKQPCFLPFGKIDNNAYPTL
jgi:hypothetical protein